MRAALLALALPALLAACATPYQRCIGPEGRELAVLERLIGESEAALARGYRYEREVRVRPALQLCAGGRVLGCAATEPYETRRPVAIVPAEERAKLAGLIERRQALRRAAGAKIEACRAAAA